MKRVVSNASPLIILAKADLLELLPKEFQRVVVPRAVAEEILQGPESDPMRKVVKSLPWLEHVSLEPTLTPLAYWQLGEGEAEVLRPLIVAR